MKKLHIVALIVAIAIIVTALVSCMDSNGGKTQEANMAAKFSTTPQISVSAQVNHGKTYNDISIIVKNTGSKEIDIIKFYCRPISRYGTQSYPRSYNPYIEIEERIAAGKTATEGRNFPENTRNTVDAALYVYYIHYTDGTEWGYDTYDYELTTKYGYLFNVKPAYDWVEDRLEPDED